jgi:hypothetical protein
MRIPSLSILLFVVSSTVGLAAVASAAEPDAMPPPPDESPQRAACDAEIARDARWNAVLEKG